MTVAHSSSTLIVLAKAPRAGRVKTRLCPPCTPEQAARLAEAALSDTLRAVAGVPGVRRVLALDGNAGPWLVPGFEVIGQGGGGLARRLGSVFARMPGPALLVGMDTPQVDAAVLGRGITAITEGGFDAVLGPTFDGGYWAIGLRRGDPEVFRDVPMSDPRTLTCQRRRLATLGLRSAELPLLRDVDRFGDAQAVARQAPGLRFAEAVRALTC